MKIEILSNSTGSLAKTDVTKLCEIGSSENERQGDSLNTLSFTLSPVTKEACIEPGTCIRLTYDDDTYLDYSVVSDTVKIASKGAWSTPAYTHEIQCVQWARKLCYRAIRGKDLSQPYNAPRKDAVLNQIFYPTAGSTKDVKLYGESYSRPLGLISASGFPTEYVKAGGTVSMRFIKIYSAQGLYYTHFDDDVNLPVYPQVVTGDGTVLFTIHDMIEGDKAKHTITQAEADKINASIKEGKAIRLKLDTIPVACFDDFSIDSITCTVRQIAVDLRYSTDTYRYTYRDVLESIAKCSALGYSLNVSNSFVDVAESLPYAVTASENGLTEAMLSLPSPDFQFQQNTSVYDAVSEVLKTLGGKPTLDFDGNLGIVFFNKRSEEIDKFNFIDEMRNVTDSKRTNAVILPYQNGTPRTACEHPLSLGNTPRYTHPRCKSLGIASETDYYLTTENPIYQVKEMYAKLAYNCVFETTIIQATEDGTVTLIATQLRLGELDGSNNAPIDLDITDFVFDASSYNLLDEYQSTDNFYGAVKQNSLRYDIGDNGVFVGNIFRYAWFSKTYTFEYCIETALRRMLIMPAQNIGDAGYASEKPLTYSMRCVYYPIVNGNVRVESPIAKDYGDEKETEIVVAQKSGIVSLEKLGLSALGSVSMLGEETMTATHCAYCYTTKKPLAGMWLKDGNDYWIVQEAKSTQLINGVYKAILTLSKGFNKVSDRVRIDRSLRMTEISQSIVLKSEMMLRDYVYFTDGNLPLSLLKPNSKGVNYYCGFTPDGFNKLVLGTLVGTYGSNTQKAIIYRQKDAKQGIVAPTACYSAGTSICFESNFVSPTSAGNCTRQETNSIMTRHVMYTDDNGFLEYFDFAVVDEDAEISFSDDPYLESDEVAYPGGQTLHTYFDLNYTGKLIGIRKAMALKAPNDILGFSYQLFSLPYKGGKTAPIVYANLASRCPYVSGTPWSAMRMYINKTDVPYSQFETTPRGTLLAKDVQCSWANAMYSASVKYDYAGIFAFKDANGNALTANSKCNGWMLTDAFGNPLLASNNGLSSGSAITIKAFASHKRL